MTSRPHPRPRIARLTLLALCLAAGLIFGPTGGGARASPTDDPSRQVLVMVRLAPEHVRPGSSYGGAYGDGMGRGARWRVVARLARERGLTVVDDWPMPVVGMDCFILTLPAEASPVEVAASLSREPGILWSEPMNLYRGQAAPATHNDPLYPAQPAAHEWRLAQLHQLATGRNVRVAVIDSMVESTHPDLVGQVEINRNFVLDHASAPEQHGTNVAGVIAARADNGLGIAGVAPRARLLALRACWQAAAGKAATLCDSLSLAKALDFAITHKAQVINMSLSGPTDRLLGKLLDVAVTRHVVVVGAYDRDLPGGGFPASHPGVVAVADEAWGSPPAGVYSAPGSGVPTTQPGGRWTLVDGSSFAAAHVAGLFALLRERAALTGAMTLVAARPAGGAIDACRSVMRDMSWCNRQSAEVGVVSASVRQ
ncbi:MAG TPA: S8 family serine peptidase [Caulobacteraceae bacterium]